MTISSEAPVTFGALLKRYRVAAGLSQEALAERAQLTAQGISALERGLRNTPHRDTVELLVRALALSAEERVALEATVRRRQGPPAMPSTPSAPQAAAPTMPASLPVAPSPLIGRDGEQATAADLLRRDEVRLLTLTGPGGVGKTRLAMQVAADLTGAFADGIVFVPLAPLGDAGLVPATVAQLLGLQESGERSLRESLLTYLQEKHLLLVLDNFEHIVAATPLVADLLGAGRRLKLLVTSRASLGLRDEHELAITPLVLPDPADLSDLDALAASPAVALFVQRARGAKADFTLSEANAPAVVEVCRRLDGLPLALELAAPWTKLLPPAALLARLERRLPLLAGRALDLPPRHQTLRDTIAWSYDLLDAAEQRLFRRLAIFVGGCTLEAADAVCVERADDNAIGQIEQDEIALLEGLASLVNKSLLRQEEYLDPRTETAEPRLLMLETVREFGLECLAAGGEAETLHRDHAAYFLALVEEAAPLLRGPEQRAWLECLDREHDNLRAVLLWARESGEAATGLRLAGALWHFWYTRGHLSEGRRWLEDLLALAESGERLVSTEPRARALLWAATFATELGDYERALALCARGEPLCQELDDTWGLAWSLNIRGVIASHHGDYAGAEELYERSLALYRGLDDRWSVALLLANLGLVARDLGDDARAAALYDESLALSRAIGDTWSVAVALSNLAEVARDTGDLERTAALSEESLASFRELGDKRGIAASLTYLGLVAREEGAYARALELYQESLILCRQVGERSRIATCLEGVAEVAGALGQGEQAARLLGAAAALREAIGAPVPVADQPEYQRTVAVLQSALPGYERMRQAGRSLRLEQAVTEALAIAGAAG